ncbi:MAG TPA: DUF6644 family protein [Terracidiphilus sp.]|jgi:hypothetical protein
MPDILAFCKWLEQTPVGAGVRESVWLFPIIESLHLLGMAVLVGTIFMLDLRLLGWTMRRVRVSALAGWLFPWTWAGLIVQVITGAVLFSSEAAKLYPNPAFRLKLILIGAAGIHALLFHRLVYRDVAAWNDSAELPMGAKIAGLISIVLWAGIVTAGRFIGFV